MTCGPALRCVSFGVFLITAHACVDKVQLLTDGGPCPAGQVNCGAGCEDLTEDPNRCGDCGIACDGDEYCRASTCQCRPGLVRAGESCIDPDTNPAACGPAATTCADPMPFCQQGACVTECALGYHDCAPGACVVTSSDPLNCNTCSVVCAPDEVCASEACQPFQPAPTCSSCPCPTCVGSLCCPYPGDPTVVICVSGATVCP